MRVTSETKSRILAILANARRKSPKWAGFTLVELIVVITILAILATIGFLALSGYSSDAKDAALKANVRSVHTAISSESVTTGNSPRYYVVHDTGAELTGAFVYVDGNQTYLTGGNWNDAGTNYTAGNPDYAKLKLNPEKFKVSASSLIPRAFAAGYDSKYLSVGALDVGINVGTSRPRPLFWFQVAGVDPTTKKASVMGTFPNTLSSGGSSAGLIRDPAGTATGAVIDGAVAGTVAPSGPVGPVGPTDPSYGNVSLLLHGDGASGGQNNSFIDSSSYAYAVTKGGNTSQGSFSPFGIQGGSAYFDGAGDSLAVANWATVSGTGDFTYEYWIWPESFASSYRCILTNDTAGGLSHCIYSDWTVFYWQSLQSILWTTSTSGSKLNFWAWNHVALVRSSGTLKIYINGVSAYSGASATNFLAGVWRIGTDGGGANFPFRGYLSNVRIRKDAAYLANFTPPAAPLASDANTTALLRFENASVTDSAKGNDIETQGNAQNSSTLSMFWGSSLAFDGAGDFLDVANAPWQNLWSQDWTVETWVRFNNVSTMYQGVFSKDDFQWMALELNEQSADAKLAFWMDTTGATPWDLGGSYGKKTTTALVANQWYHVAITRQSGTVRFYLNGNLEWTDSTAAGAVYNSAAPVHIGRSQLSTRYMNGNIDDFRVTSGVARYTGTGFTIPSSAYPDQ